MYEMERRRAYKTFVEQSQSKSNKKTMSTFRLLALACSSRPNLGKANLPHYLTNVPHTIGLILQDRDRDQDHFIPVCKVGIPIHWRSTQRATILPLFSFSNQYS